MVTDIGGYIELCIKAQSSHYHKNAIPINLARNGIQYIIKANGIKQMWVPYYTCPVVWETIKSCSCKINFYNIDEDFMPKVNLFDDYVLYTNYFGVLGDNSNLLARRYSNIILDNAQAFFAVPEGLASIYSPRKFFGVPDGGYVYSKKHIDNLPQDHDSYKVFSHLLKRNELGANFGYSEFNLNEDILSKTPLKLMSNLTTKLLCAQEYDEIKKQIISNYTYLHRHLSNLNRFNHLHLNGNVPMYYPLLIEEKSLRSKLIKNNIFIPTCWRGIESVLKKNSFEFYLKENLLLLIIDQRYDTSHMDFILSVILN